MNRAQGKGGCEVPSSRRWVGGGVRGEGRVGGREEVGERSEQRAASQGSFFRLRMQSEKSRA